jgi:hypothetical protein
MIVSLSGFEEYLLIADNDCQVILRVFKVVKELTPDKTSCPWVCQLGFL